MVETNHIPEITNQPNDIEDAFSDTPQTSNPDIYIPKKNKDIIFGKLIREVRISGNNLLFAMLTNIARYEIINNDFVITCSQMVNYQDLISENNNEILNNLLQKIDSELSFKVQLEEDKSKEILANNIATLKRMFGKLIKFIE